jgi:hypothetical protein
LCVRTGDAKDVQNSGGHFTLGLFHAVGRRVLRQPNIPNSDGTGREDFRFHTGEVLPELVALHDDGAPSGDVARTAVPASGQTMLANNFAGELFGPGSH